MAKNKWWKSKWMKPIFLTTGIFGFILAIEGIEDFLVPILYLEKIWALTWTYKLGIGTALVLIAVFIGNIRLQTIKKNTP